MALLACAVCVRAVWGLCAADRFVNREDVDFEAAQDMPATQKWELVENLGGEVEYPTRCVGRFPRGAGRMLTQAAVWQAVQVPDGQRGHAALSRELRRRPDAALLPRLQGRVDAGHAAGGGVRVRGARHARPDGHEAGREAEGGVVGAAPSAAWGPTPARAQRRRRWRRPPGRGRRAPRSARAPPPKTSPRS